MYKFMNKDEVLNHKNGYDEYYAVYPDMTVYRVSGKAIKIKGYSKFKFFIHKLGKKDFNIREVKSGMKIGSAETMSLCKKDAKETLDKEVAKDKILFDSIINNRIANVKDSQNG